MVKQLHAEPALTVQLVGKASPEGAEAFNLELGARRARLIAKALEGEGIGQDRLAAAPLSRLPSGCKVLEDDSRLVTCGELGATGDNDRQVLAQFFLPADK